MVRTIRHSIWLLLAIVLIAGCEVISEKDRLIALDPQPTATNARGQLLIEYTGVGCVNCPKAAQTAHELEQLYDNLIVVAMHPKSNPFTKASAKYDYTCAEADVYYRFMDGQPTTPFPTGNLNITASEDGTYFTDQTSWAAQLLTHRNDTATVAIATAVEAGEGENEVKVTVYLSPKSSDIKPCRLMLWVTEDSIVGAQNMPDGSTNLEYVHNHMLRASLNGDWGEAVTFANGEMLTKEGIYTLSDKWVRKNCRIVAVLIDEETREAITAAKGALQL